MVGVQSCNQTVDMFTMLHGFRVGGVGFRDLRIRAQVKFLLKRGWAGFVFQAWGSEVVYGLGPEIQVPQHFVQPSQANMKPQQRTPNLPKSLM